MTRIGIIEDDRLLNEALCTYLETLGYLTESAFSFEEGMALTDKYHDLLLVDIGLADGSGTEICRAVCGKAPVIFLTARDGEEDMLKAFDCGADDYLVKPFPMPVRRTYRRWCGEAEAVRMCFTTGICISTMTKNRYSLQEAL